jgi:hypothetical protein
VKSGAIVVTDDIYEMLTTEKKKEPKDLVKVNSLNFRTNSTTISPSNSTNSLSNEGSSYELQTYFDIQNSMKVCILSKAPQIRGQYIKHFYTILLSRNKSNIKHFYTIHY